MAPTSTVGPQPSWRQLVILVVAGLAVWLGFVAIPTRGDPNWNGVWWFVVLPLVAIDAGLLWPRRPAVELALALVGPALALVLWTAPKADNDGLWIFWCPLVAIWTLPTMGGVAVGSWLRRWAGRVRR